MNLQEMIKQTIGNFIYWIILQIAFAILAFTDTLAWSWSGPIVTLIILIVAEGWLWISFYYDNKD